MIRGRESKSAPIGVVSRVLRILEALHDAPGGLHLKEVSKLTGINKATAYRILAHLESEGYLFRGNAGAYFIGPKLVRLASATNHQAVLRETSGPILHRLWEETGETVNLAVPDGNDVLYLDVIESPHSFRLVSRAGMRRPLHSTALGKVVLAYLPRAEREKLLSSIRLNGHSRRLARLRKELTRVCQYGYAMDDEGSTLGARCVGAPILEGKDRVVAAISVSGPTIRIGKKQIPALGTKVAQAAQAISSQLVCSI